MTTLLDLRSVSLSSGSNHRLKDITLSIQQGEKVALLGQSGSGKTTLIKVANGTLKPTIGKVLWKGIELNKLKRRQKSEIGTLWQDLKLIKELTVCQNVNAGALGRKNALWALRNIFGLIDNENCRKCLQVACLEEILMNKSISSLSGGQQQRVAIARLVHQQPKIILADEPLSSLDPQIANDILNLLLTKRKNSFYTSPNTCVVSLHRPDLLEGFTRVIGLKSGEIFFDIPIGNLNKTNINKLYL